MTAQHDNVIPLPLDWEPQLEALAEARRYPQDHLDSLLLEAAQGDAAIGTLVTAGRAIRVPTADDPRTEQAIRHAVRMEQRLAEIEELAHRWAAMKSGQMRGVGNTLLDVINGTPGDPDNAA
jgi:hypothetical protein